MTYNSEFRKEYLKKVNKFKEKDWVKNHIQLEDKPNFWSIIEYGKIASSRQLSSHEIRYSKMLRWLLDANENHNLGNEFAYKLIEKINKINRIGKDIPYNHSLDKNKHIKCNTEALKKEVDIFYEDHDQKVCIAIELKQHSLEHKSTGYESQLAKYEDAVDEFEKEENEKFQKIYIYLTPQKESPSRKNWEAVGYKEIIEIIEAINEEFLSKSEDIYKEDRHKIINDFKDDMQRTIDSYEKDISYVMKNFSKEEIKFTSILADEITHEGEGEYINKLIELDKYANTNIELKKILLLINEYISIQDHTPNDGVRLLMRKIFNRIAEESVLDLDLNRIFTPEERKSNIKSSIVEGYKLDFTQIGLTSGKGQGIYLYNKLKNRRIYFSGDMNGHFPNDYMSVLVTEEDGPIRSENIKNRMFEVNYNLIKEDKITIKQKNPKTSEVISFYDLMEIYVLKEIKVLNDRLNQLKETI